MKGEHDYIRDLAEIRSMMERSSRFLSLSGMAGVLAGVYALTGAFVAYRFLGFQPVEGGYDFSGTRLRQLMLLGLVVLFLSVSTAIFLSARKASKRGERLWNPIARRMVLFTLVPLVAGGILVLILIAKGLIGFVAPCTLVFYGLALFNASHFTYNEVRNLGLIQVLLGLIGSYFIGHGLLLWALGFGVAHIIYGIYIHYRYQG